MKAEIRATYNVSNPHEISVERNGYSYLVIYGQHINGWFIAIPNQNVCVEAAHPTETFYNAENLGLAMRNKSLARAFADAVEEHWNSISHEVVLDEAAAPALEM